jgi:hypothetical protein
MSQKILNDSYGPVQSNLENQLKAKAPVNIVPSNSGIMQTETPSPLISFHPTTGAYKLENRNAFIVFGKDMPSTVLSGYGGKGASNCDTIDIVVGRMSSVDEITRPNALINFKRPKIVGNSYGADAARIYISQLTDVDKNFGIAKGKSGLLKARSTVAIKADGVRLVGREGIKIVTGKSPFEGFGEHGEKNSRGGKIIQPAPMIELIAGNNDEPKKVRGGLFQKKEVIQGLQPLVKGDNMNDALLELSALLHKINSAMSNFVMTQIAFNSAVAVNLFPPNTAHHAAAGTAANLSLMNNVVNNLHHQRIQLSLFETNFCTPYGYKYICSKNVTTT